MSNWIETKLKDLAEKIESRLERDGTVDRALMEEFTTYHKVWSEYKASLRLSGSSEEDSDVQSAPLSRGRKAS